MEKPYTDIFQGNKSGGKDSCSGPGSDLHQTRIIVKEMLNEASPLTRQANLSPAMQRLGISPSS